MKKLKFRTWMGEQLVLVVVVGVALWLQATGKTLTGKDWAIAIAGSLGVMVGQQIRSGADRQVEQNTLAGVTPAKLQCSKDMTVMGMGAQVLAVATTLFTATTWAHCLILAYTIGYPEWRRWYRSKKPAKLGEEQ